MAIHLERLDHVPGSVAMTEYCYYDGLKSRWIDIWEPVQDKSRARVQSIRCYTPADLFLLLEGTGLKTHAILYQGKLIDFEHTEIRPDLLYSDTNGSYTYTAMRSIEPDGHNDEHMMRCLAAYCSWSFAGSNF
ncbi:hypothetical protein JXQ70_10690 [bacterium]|nr:hypothetical protein [bacterium]